MSWTVYDKNGIERCVVHKLEYSGQDKGERFISFSISSPIAIKWGIGDYVDYREDRFTLNYMPTEEKKSSPGSSGESFVYDSIKMNSYANELSRCQFLDFVKNDSFIHYSSLPSFSFYAETVQALADRLQVNLDRFYKNPDGSSLWHVYVDSSFKGKTGKSISVNNISCMEALSLSFTEFEAPYVIKGRDIKIGGEGISVQGQLFYGKGNGLVRLKRSANSDQLIISRLRAYGSTKNLPSRYYNKLKDPSGQLYIPESMYVPNLMLPDFPSKTSDVYYEDPDIISKIGVREGSVFFDGSGDNEEIFPTIEGMKDSQGNALDEIVSVENPKDYGVKENLVLEEIESIDDKGSGTMMETNTSYFGYITKALYKPIHRGFFNIGGGVAVKLSVSKNNPINFFTMSVKTTVSYTEPGSVWKELINLETKSYIVPNPPTSIAELEIITDGINLEAPDGINAVYVRYDVSYTVTDYSGDQYFQFIRSINGIAFVREYDEYDFPIFIRDLGFDIEEKNEDGEYVYIVPGQTPLISMKTGRCSGREFEIVSTLKKNDGYEIRLNRVEDSSIGIMFPNQNDYIASGDKFVILNINLPEVYITSASQRLLEAAEAYYYKNSETRYTYEPEIDNIYINKHPEVAELISEGNILNFKDEDLGIEGGVLISKLSIKEGEFDLPQYNVTLKEGNEPSFIQRVTENVSSKMSSSGFINTTQLSGLIENIGKNLFVSKVNKDSANGPLTIQNGATLNGVLDANELINANSGIVAKSNQTSKELSKAILEEADEEPSVMSTAILENSSAIGVDRFVDLSDIDPSFDSAGNGSYLLNKQDGVFFAERYYPETISPITINLHNSDAALWSILSSNKGSVFNGVVGDEIYNLQVNWSSNKIVLFFMKQVDQYYIIFSKDDNSSVKREEKYITFNN